MTLTQAARLGVSTFTEAPVRANYGQDPEVVIRAVYKQVLGNTYILDSDRLKGAESLFKQGELTVRELVRKVAKSGLYQKRFFNNCFTLRFIELNFKHLLGRAPNNYTELKSHTDLFEAGGYEAEIDSYINSDEYLSAFGEDTVPYYRGFTTQTNQTTVEFTHMFQLLRGPAGSDLPSSVSANLPVLTTAVIRGNASAVVAPSGGSSGWAFQGDSNTPNGVGASREGRIYRLEVTNRKAAGVVRNRSEIRRSNQVLLVTYDQLSNEYQRIHKSGGIIASITALN